MMTNRLCRSADRGDRSWSGLLAVLLLPALAGCPQYADPTVPNEIRKVSEPATRQDYFIYVPTRYKPDRPASLVILCHGTKPWDTPLRQIRDWVKLAEEKNFLVAAPELKGTRGDFPPPADRQIELQRADERTILACLRHIRGAYNIDETRTFLAGWSAGGYAVLYTGLRHPEIFRALAVMQGNFNAAYLSEVAGRIDPYQPVYVIYGSTDVLTGSHGTEAIQWLYDQDAYVVDGRVPGPHRAHPRAAYEFFARTVRETPWMQIRASQAPGGGPLEVQFRLRTSFDVRTYAWEFGDGETSPVAEPVHRFAAPGEYVVTCTASGGSHKNVRRRLRLEVPLLHAPPGLSE